MKEIKFLEVQIPIIQDILACVGPDTLTYEQIVECMYKKYKGESFRSYLRYEANTIVVDETNKNTTFTSHIMGLLGLLDEVHHVLDSRMNEYGKREYWLK